MRTLELHPDASVVPGLTDRPGFKELLIEDLSDVIEAKTPSTFALNNTVQNVLTHCDYFPHRDEILQLLEDGSDMIKKGLT